MCSTFLWNFRPLGDSTSGEGVVGRGRKNVLLEQKPQQLEVSLIPGCYQGHHRPPAGVILLFVPIPPPERFLKRMAKGWSYSSPIQWCSTLITSFIHPAASEQNLPHSGIPIRLPQVWMGKLQRSNLIQVWEECSPEIRRRPHEEARVLCWFIALIPLKGPTPLLSSPLPSSSTTYRGLLWRIKPTFN